MSVGDVPAASFKFRVAFRLEPQTALYCYDSSYDDNDIVGAEQQLQLRVLQQRWGCLSSLLAFFPRHVRRATCVYEEPTSDPMKMQGEEEGGRGRGRTVWVWQ